MIFWTLVIGFNRFNRGSQAFVLGSFILLGIGIQFASGKIDNQRNRLVQMAA